MNYKPPGPAPCDDRIEVVIVCLNYADFLSQTLPYNLPHVDRVAVVTTYGDARTHAVCRKWSVECVVTDSIRESGQPFNKGAAINHGLAALRMTGWVLLLDADIVLPLTFRNMLDKSALNQNCIYGAERVNIRSWSAWQAFRIHRYHSTPQFGWHCLVTTPEDMPIGANLVHRQYGFCPIGYFQLFHAAYLRQHHLRYPETEASAELMDVQFALRWPREDRRLLPSVRVFHLESERAAMGTNWGGRKTKPFTHDGEESDLSELEQGGYGYAAPSAAGPSSAAAK